MNDVSHLLKLMDQACDVVDKIQSLNLDEQLTDRLITMVIHIIQPPMPYFVPSEYGSIKANIKQ